MTQGSIQKQILSFALPLFIGNLFQQLYSAADSLIVGRFRGSEALAAISSSGSLIFLTIGFFNGMAMGAGVVIGRYFGAKDYDRVRRSIHTDIAFGLLAGLFLTVFGSLMSPVILRWMGTPADVMPNSILYFRVLFLGIIGNLMYNILQGVHQAIGDSTHPLYYLIISSVTNIILDVLFVGVMGFSVGAAALATIISQFLSSILSLTHLMRGPEEYRVRLKEIRIDKELMKEVIRNGLPSGVQNSIISLANVVMQSNINAFGAVAMAGCGAYMKVEGFGFIPVNCFILSLTTFVSQNLGAKKYDRAKKGAVFGIICGVLSAELIGALVFTFAPQIIGLFDSNPEAISFGVQYTRTVTLFYCLLAFSHCCAGILRGAGKAVVPMVVMAVCWCLIRVTYVTIAVKFRPEITTVVSAWPLTWILSAIILAIYLVRSDWIHGFDRP